MSRGSRKVRGGGGGERRGDSQLAGSPSEENPLALAPTAPSDSVAELGFPTLAFQTLSYRSIKRGAEKPQRGPSAA